MTVHTQPWTLPQFEEQLSRYVKASRRRYRIIGLLFVGQIVLFFGILVGAGIASIHLAPAVILAVMAEFLTGMVALAAGILITSSSFVRRFAIHCERCRAAQHYHPYDGLLILSPVWRALELLLHSSPKERIELCRNCGAVIAR